MVYAALFAIHFFNLSIIDTDLVNEKSSKYENYDLIDINPLKDIHTRIILFHGYVLKTPQDEKLNSTQVAILDYYGVSQTTFCFIQYSIKYTRSNPHKQTHIYTS